MRIDEQFQQWEQTGLPEPDMFDEQAEKERRWRQGISENRARFATDLSVSLRKLYHLEQDLGGKPGTLSEWAQAAYEINEDFEDPYVKVVGDICAALRDVDHQYGRRIALQLYNTLAVILASEIRPAACYLSLGGRFESLKGLADAGFFSVGYGHDTTIRAVQFMNSGGNADEIYRVISKDGTYSAVKDAPAHGSAKVPDEKQRTWQEEPGTLNPMLKLAAQIRKQTCGLCRVGPGPFGFGVCNETISQIGMVICITPDPANQPALIPQLQCTVSVKAVSNSKTSAPEIIGSETLEKLSVDADAATQLVAKAALELCGVPIRITGQEYSDALDALAQMERMGLDGGISESEARQLDRLGWYKDKSPDEITAFQLFEARLCMPFNQFHAAVEGALGRPVWTHEFADPTQLQEEFRDKLRPENAAPTMTL